MIPPVWWTWRHAKVNVVAECPRVNFIHCIRAMSQLCDDLILTIMILFQVMVIKTAIRMAETEFTIVDHILDKTREKF